MFKFLFSNKATSSISPEMVNKVVDNTTTYAGVKVSETTYKYFANATEHFANAGQAAANCGGYAALTATYAAKTAVQGVLGLCAYKEFAGEVMTGHAFGFAMPAFAKAIVGAAASAIYHHPTAVMGAFVGAAVLASPENAFETVKNAAYTGIEVANFAYENAAGIVNATAGIGHLVYDNLPGSFDVNANEMVIAGAPAFLAIEAY